MNNKFYIFIVVFTILIFNSYDSYAEINPYELYSVVGSDISPSGKLAKAFILGSDYTDLQREDILNEIKNEVVDWRLPVYEVKKDSEGEYIITTVGNSNVIGCIIHLSTFNPNQEKFVHSLKTGSYIPVRGFITGKTFMRNLILNPAVLLDPR